MTPALLDLTSSAKCGMLYVLRRMERGVLFYRHQTAIEYIVGKAPFRKEDSRPVIRLSNGGYLAGGRFAMDRPEETR